MRVRKDSGFTLVELMIVVAIIALLAGLAASKVKAAVDSSRQTKVAHDIKVIQDALERHYQERGYYPVKLNRLTELGYLKTKFDFKVPTSNLYYFYAVDDNRKDESPHAYILGAPGRDAGPAGQLYRMAPLPRGKRTDYKARAWIHADFNISESTLWVFDENDEDILDTPPAWLGLYRTACRQTMPEPCDVYTN